MSEAPYAVQRLGRDGRWYPWANEYSLAAALMLQSMLEYRRGIAARIRPGVRYRTRTLRGNIASPYDATVNGRAWFPKRTLR